MSVATSKSPVHVTSISIKKIGNDACQNNTSPSGVYAEHAEIDSLWQQILVAPAMPALVTEKPQVTNGTQQLKREDGAVTAEPNQQVFNISNNNNTVPSSAVDVQNFDGLVPADSLWTTDRYSGVKLRMKTSGPGSEAPITVATLLQSTVDKIPNNVAMAVKRNGEWVRWTYAQYMADVRTAAKAFISVPSWLENNNLTNIYTGHYLLDHNVYDCVSGWLGLEPSDGVGIIGFNSPEWFLADLGCIFAGGLATGIYTTNSPEACQYVAEKCRASVIVVENNQQLQKILQVKANLPCLKAIVQYTGEVAVREDFIYSWSEFMQKGQAVSDGVLNERMKALAPNKCCVLIYTSGTTGNPKGVMLSHDNITWTAHATKYGCTQNLPLKFGELFMVSYLPLSHIAAQMLDIYVLIAFGGTTYFAQPDALKGSLASTLKEVQPHVFLGVPRVWEKMQENMQNAARSVTGLKKKIGAWAKGVGKKANYAKMLGQSPPMSYGLANKLLFKKVRGLLGMDRCVMRLSGAAPITKETLEYFLSLDLPICEVYGMSECTGPHTTGFPLVNRLGSVGKEMPGVETVLDKMDEDGNGEIVMHGRHVFMGYLDEVEKTKEVLDSSGGLHSGDIGRKDENGFLYITGRIKELIITAGGENIPPVAIEDSVKEALPIVSQCMLIGDKMKFLSLLLTLKVDVNQDTQEPSDMLTPSARDWVKSVGSAATTVTEILEPGDRAVLQAIQRGIDLVNSRATSNAQKIQKWSLLPKDFSIPGGELGPTMKMRRPVIVKMYTKTISAFYEDPAVKSP